MFYCFVVDIAIDFATLIKGNTGIHKNGSRFDHVSGNQVRYSNGLHKNLSILCVNRDVATAFTLIVATWQPSRSKIQATGKPRLDLTPTTTARFPFKGTL